MENRNSHKGLVTGLIIALIGTLLLLRNVGVLDYSITHYIISWKTLLVAIGLVAISRGKYACGLIVAGLGVIFWLPEIFNHQFTLHQVFLPSLLMIIGIVLLMKAGGHDKRKDPEGEYVSFEEIKTDESTGETA
jgi:predicted membrane protein